MKTTTSTHTTYLNRQVILAVGFLALALSLFVSVASATYSQASHSGKSAKAEASSPRVVDGEKASIRQLPFVVSLVEREMRNGKKIRSAYWGHYCTGILLTRTVVLTAGHCSPRASSTSTDTDVVIGRSNLDQHRRGERIALLGSTELYKPDSNGDGYHDYGADLGIHRLSRPARKGRPLGLHRLGSPQSGMARVAGWGYTRHGRPRLLQKADIPRLPDKDCAAMYPRENSWNRYYFVTGAQICAGYAGPGADACMGDSGGPLLQGGRLVGIVSWGNYYCGEEGAGVYVRVDRWKRWIKRQVRGYQRKWWKDLTPHRPIREKGGWTMPRRDAFRITDGIDWTAHVSSLTSWGYQHHVSIGSNRPVRGATISIEGKNKLCPGNWADYPTLWPENDDNDERCKSSFSMRPGRGGEEASWMGWASDHRDSCPRITVRATIAGKPYRKTYRSCTVQNWRPGI